MGGIMASRSTRQKIKDQYRGIQADLVQVQSRLAMMVELCEGRSPWIMDHVDILYNVIEEVKSAFTKFREGI